MNTDKTRASCPSERDLLDLLHESLAPEITEGLESHLAKCESCQERFHQLLAHNVDADHIGAKTMLEQGAGATQRPARTSPKMPHERTFELPGFEEIRYLDQGGMGIVYRAKQVRHGREVAIKLVRPEWLSEDFLKRFEREIQIQATLEQANVARLYDVGEAPDGQLFVVMEFVDGVPIDEYCRERQLNLRHRLALFTKACDVVQELHNHQIIHRDLKPSHILIREGSDGPEPVLIDLGLAKYANPISPQNEELTQPNSPLGSIRYMSPEQASGKTSRLTTLTDEYSLGVILYLLLTGDTPLDETSRKGADLVDLLRRIQEGATKAPSVRLRDNRDARASHCQSLLLTHDQLINVIAGDLDAITLKALRNDPKERYASVAEFAADLRRWLTNDVVMARQPTRRERAAKFYRRNRSLVWTFCAFVVVCLSAVAATSVGLWQAKVAEENARQAATRESKEHQAAEIARAEADEKRTLAEERLKNFMAASQLLRSVFDNLNPETASAGDGSLRQAMLKNIKQASQEIRSLPLGTSDEVLVTKASLANVSLSLGDPESAVEQWENIVADVETLKGRRSKEAVEARINLAVTLIKVLRLQESQDLLVETKDIAKELYPDGDLVRLTIGHFIGVIQGMGGHLDTALDIHEQLIELLKKHGHVGTPLWMDGLNSLGVLQFRLERYADAIATYRLVLESAEGAYPENHPFLLVTRSNLAVARGKSGEGDVARETLEQLLKTAEASLPSESLWVGRIKLNLATICASLDDPDRANELLAEIVEECQSEHLVMRARIEWAALKIWHLDQVTEGESKLAELLQQCKDKLGAFDENTQIAKSYLEKIAATHD